MRKMYILLILLAVVAFSGCAQTQKYATQNQAGIHTGQAGQAKHMGQMGRGGAGKGLAVNKNGTVNLQNLKGYIYSIKTGNLTDVEKKDMMHMVEEEKLARDVYTTLYDKWKNRTFYNIAKSEQTHLDAVRLLIEKYNLTDPTKGKGIGQFANPRFEKLYTELVANGSKSLVDALKVGALIEELDIVDLQNCINHTNKQDIKIVYENLMKGSRNHLRAFVSKLKKLGVYYEPVYLSKKEFEAIIFTGTERGPATQPNSGS